MCPALCTRLAAAVFTPVARWRWNNAAGLRRSIKKILPIILWLAGWLIRSSLLIGGILNHGDTEKEEVRGVFLGKTWQVLTSLINLPGLLYPGLYSAGSLLLALLFEGRKLTD